MKIKMKMKNDEKPHRTYWIKKEITPESVKTTYKDYSLEDFFADLDAVFENILTQTKVGNDHFGKSNTKKSLYRLLVNIGLIHKNIEIVAKELKIPLKIVKGTAKIYWYETEILQAIFYREVEKIKKLPLEAQGPPFRQLCDSVNRATGVHMFIENVYLGHDENRNKIEIDFDKEKINFILLAGRSGSGKTIFDHHLYRELVNIYSPNEVGFVFLDMPRVEFYGWSSNYLIKPVVTDVKEAIYTLYELAELKTNKKIFVHIEECDMVYQNRKAVEKAFKMLKKRDNICIIYSTSKLDRDYLDRWMKEFINLKVVFAVPTEDDSVFLTGSKMADHFTEAGERVLIFNDRQIICRPFSNKEAGVLNNFKL